MKLSVIVPVYNGEGYIKKCLISLVSQTYLNLEIIVVNDGSTDDTLEIVNKLKEEYQQKEIIIINKINEGLPQARKTGVEAASGEYIGFVDADDWIESNYFEDLMRAAENNNAEMICAGFSQDFSNSYLQYKNPSGVKIIDSEEAVKLLHERKGVYQYAWNKIYKKDILEQVNFPQKNLIGEDYAIVSQILQIVNNVGLVNNSGYHYVVLSDSMSHTGYNDLFENGIKMYQKRRIAMLNSFPQHKNVINNFMVQNYMGAIMAMCQNNNFDKEIEDTIATFVRKNLLSFLIYSPSSLIWTLGVIGFCINKNVFYKFYELLKK